MRKAKYDRQQVVCRKASCLGSSSNVARPGYWVITDDGTNRRVGRVMGRIARTTEGDCRGWLAVMTLSDNAAAAFVRWVHPDEVVECYEKPPAALLAWITGDEWVRDKDDIARLIAMAQHGTTSEQFIASRDDPEKPYNDPARRNAYNGQYILPF